MTDHHRTTMLAVTVSLFALLLTLPFAPSLPAQEPGPPPPEQPRAEFEEEVEVVEVFVDVLVTDRKGNVIRGLGEEDFVVLEDGEPREVTGVTFYTTRYEDLGEAGAEHPVATREGADTPAVPASRYFIFFFHDQAGAVTDESALVRNRLDAAREAHLWIRDEMGPSDWIAVVRFDQSLTVHTDFTQHRGTILAAIEDATMNRPSEIMKPSTRDRIAAGSGPSLLRELPASFDLRDAAVRVSDAVRLVAEASGHIVGRKNLILFTLGFGKVESPLGAPDSRYYPPMERALNDNNVAVYPIDLMGSTLESPQTNFLSQLADDTGGELHKTFHRFLVPLQRIASSTTGYYLVSFRSEHPAGESGYRTFEVKLPDEKGRVKARRGYLYGDESSESGNDD